jgi:hypothetical protein
MSLLSSISKPRDAGIAPLTLAPVRTWWPSNRQASTQLLPLAAGAFTKTGLESQVCGPGLQHTLTHFPVCPFPPAFDQEPYLAALNCTVQLAVLP